MFAVWQKETPQDIWMKFTIGYRARFLWRKRFLERLNQLYTAKEAEEWMDTPQEALGGKSATDMIATGHHEKVDQVIRQLEDLTYV